MEGEGTVLRLYISVVGRARHVVLMRVVSYTLGEREAYDEHQPNRSKFQDAGPERRPSFTSRETQEDCLHDSA